MSMLRDAPRPGEESRHPHPPVAQADPPKPDETADESGAGQRVPESRAGLPDCRQQARGRARSRRAIRTSRPQAANALADEYVTQNLEVKMQGTQSMLTWLENEVRSQQKKVEHSEQELAELPRTRERDVARREEQHRALAPELAQRSRAEGAHDANRERGHQQPDQGAPARRLDRLPPRHRAAPAGPAAQEPDRRAPAPESAAVGALRRQASGNPEDQRGAGRRPASARTRKRPRRCRPSRTNTSAPPSKSARSRPTSRKRRRTSRTSAG